MENNKKEHAKAKAEFAARLSHDVRTSMNIILGMTAIAKGRLSDQARVDDCLNKINGAGKYLLILIDEVFDMEKMENGTLELLEEELNLHKLVEDLFEVMKSQIDEKRHDFIVSEEGLVHEKFIGDSMHLMQIFVNILGNAIQFTPRGGRISLTISEKKIDDPNFGCFEFIFEDNGPGMSQELLDHLFDVYVSPDEPGWEIVQNKGAGLCIADYLVKLMNGSIKVESTEGKGTKFTVTLCLRLKEDANPLKQLDDGRFSGKHILIAEDNEINAEIVKEILNEIGLIVDCVENGKEALDMLTSSEEGKYSMVFMDIQMPVMDGYEAARKIRATGREDLVNIPIIAMTAEVYAKHVRAAEEAGMNQHIAKPLNIKQIGEVLQKWI